MSVVDIMDKRSAFSFEVFPPKTDVGMEKLCGEGGVLEKLYTLNPDYISCTYGAGGTNVGKNLEVLDKITKDGKTVGVTHFTCIGNTKEGIKEQLHAFSRIKSKSCCLGILFFSLSLFKSVCKNYIFGFVSRRK